MLRCVLWGRLVCVCVVCCLVPPCGGVRFLRFAVCARQRVGGKLAGCGWLLQRVELCRSLHYNWP